MMCHLTTSTRPSEYFLPLLILCLTSANLTSCLTSRSMLLCTMKNFARILTRSLSEEKNFMEINNSVMNFLLVNGYKKSFDLFYSLNGSETNLKGVANHKDKINKEDDATEHLNVSGFRFRSNSQIRKDSEGIRSRRASLMKIEMQQAQDNEEVLRLLNHRHSKLTSHKNPDRKWKDNRSYGIYAAIDRLQHQ